jgi:hypothetical protein
VDLAPSKSTPQGPDDASNPLIVHAADPRADRLLTAYRSTNRLDQWNLNTLRRCYEHLEEGGVLLINLEAEYNSPEAWLRWLPDGRQTLPEDWRADPSTRVASDGTEHRAYFRMVDLDPLDQTYTREVRLEKGQPGEIAASERYLLRENIYFKTEVVLMLRLAGFREITVRGNWSDEPATAEHEDLIFTATR